MRFTKCNLCIVVVICAKTMQMHIHTRIFKLLRFLGPLALASNTRHTLAHTLVCLPRKSIKLPYKIRHTHIQSCPHAHVTHACANMSPAPRPSRIRRRRALQLRRRQEEPDVCVCVCNACVTCAWLNVCVGHISLVGSARCDNIT